MGRLQHGDRAQHVDLGVARRVVDGIANVNLRGEVEDELGADGPEQLPECGSVPDIEVVTENGVTVIGAGGLAATVPTAASNAFARNVSALLLHLTADGELAIDLTDEIAAGVVITHDGAVVQAATAAVLAENPTGGTAQ